MALFPSAESETENPCSPLGSAASMPTSFDCCLHTPPERAYTHAAPAPPLSLLPPTMAVLPSPESERAIPCCASPIAPLPTSLGPCSPLGRRRVRQRTADQRGDGEHM